MLEKEIFELERFLGDSRIYDPERIRKEYNLYWNEIRGKWQSDYESLFEILCKRYDNAKKYLSYYNLLFAMKLQTARRGNKV